MEALLLALLALFGVIVIMKLMICSCYMGMQRRRRDDTVPILDEDDLASRLAGKLFIALTIQDTSQSRLRSRARREPPPTFDQALVSSRPVSYIDVEEDPPTYEEYLKSSPSENVYLESSSANPTDIVIGLDTMSVTSLTIESNA
ncbi:hypothetical protein Ocin01_05770 [Orchesella cincta]|uniref:Uncharacterized protein n=1 Tax=Orchesella cincta TaxID=48709 RepID=A0A1D2N6K3_ORCCI|nr:hypothetical protein Ocin01_05770 [Orchesella cincta]